MADLRVPSALKARANNATIRLKVRTIAREARAAFARASRLDSQPLDADTGIKPTSLHL